MLLQFLAAAEIETDIPGVVDSRLAGWRAQKAGAARTGTNEEQIDASNAANEAGAGEGVEPVCGDVVEVREYLLFRVFFLLEIVRHRTVHC